MLKFHVEGKDVKLVAANDNASLNGRAIAVTNDGKGAAMAGGGGWRSKTDQHANYLVVVFESQKLEALSGQFETGAYPSLIAFHPILGYGIAVKSANSDEVFVFNSKSMVKKATFATKCQTSNAAGFVCFGGHGTKVIYCSSLPGRQKYALYLFELPLTDQDREQLAKVYGDGNPAK